MADAIQGHISDGIFPGLLRDLYVRRKRGALAFERGSEKRSVRFRDGQIINANTNVKEDRLGRPLSALGSSGRRT